MSYAQHTRDDTSFERWLTECSWWWMSHNDEDPYEYPAYDWRGWYDEGLTVEQAIVKANMLLFGRAHGA